MNEKATRIVGISANPRAGGADRIFLSIMNYLGGTTVVSTPVKESLAPDDNSVIGINYPEMSNNPRSILRLLCSLVRTSFLPSGFLQSASLVLLCDLRAVILFGPLLRLKKIPVLFHCHSTFRPTRLNKLIFGRLINLTTSLIVIPSQWLANTLSSSGVKPEKMKVIYNGLPPITHKIQPVHFEIPTIIMAGDIQEQKGQIVLCEAIRILRSSGINVAALFPGTVRENEYMNLIQRTYSDLLESGSITFPGPLPYDQLLNTLAGSSISCSLSIHSETLPTVLLEAMALNVPVIGTKVGGIPEIIADDISGILVDPNNPTETADAIKKIISSKESSDKFTTEGFKRLHEQFSVSAMCRSFSEITVRFSNSK